MYSALKISSKKCTPHTENLSLYWNNPRVWSTKTKNIENCHCTSVKEKISPFETERTQIYLNSACTACLPWTLLSISLSSTGLVCLLSLFAIKPFTLVVPMAGPLPREGAGLVMDVLQGFLMASTQGFVASPLWPLSFPDAVQSLTCASRLYTTQTKKITPELFSLQVPLLTIDSQLPEKITAVNLNKCLLHAGKSHTLLQWNKNCKSFISLWKTQRISEYF